MANSPEDKSRKQENRTDHAQKSLLKSDALYQALYQTLNLAQLSLCFLCHIYFFLLLQYILETSVYPRKPECMKELRLIMAKHPWNGLAAAADEVQFLGMLLKMLNAKNTMEIGVYTGYSLLATALALPDDGKILAFDINRENYELGLPVFKKAGVAHKIDFHLGPALPVLDQMVHEVRENMMDSPFYPSPHLPACYLFFFGVAGEADKENYLNYHKRVLELVRVGGVIGYDNTLWNGSVAAPPEAPLPDYVRRLRGPILELNKCVAADPRVEICQLSIADGLTLCRRLS